MAAADKVKAVFNQFDKNGDGELNSFEMRAVLRACNPNISNSDVRVLFRQLDRNKDGKIDIREFVDFVFRTTPDVIQRTISEPFTTAFKIKALFRKFDKNRNGVLQKDDLWRLLRGANPHMMKRHCDAIFKDLDKHKNNCIDLDEFVEYVFRNETKAAEMLVEEAEKVGKATQMLGMSFKKASADLGWENEAAVAAAFEQPEIERAVTEKASAEYLERFGKQPHHLTRYTEPHCIWQALETGHIRLIRASWLIEQNKRRLPLMRRQILPESAFIDVAQLKDLYDKGQEYQQGFIEELKDLHSDPNAEELGQRHPDKVLPIIAISYCWLTPGHPDPRGEQLAIVAASLERERRKYNEMFSEMGVFWDWLSLYQKDTQGERTPAETEGFQYALCETMDLWYAHQGTTVYMLTKLPEGATREVGYSESGWTTYERCSAEQIKHFNLQVAKWKLVLDLGADEAHPRNWPTGPDDFDDLINHKKFTNGSDKDEVKKLFRKMSVNQLGGIRKLDLGGMNHPNLEEARRFGRCLNLCTNLETLDLQAAGMSTGTLKQMCSRLCKGALENCTELQLERNRIGDEGACALSEALGRGALAHLTTLDLRRHAIGNKGMVALSMATALGALKNCTELDLRHNEISGEGMYALSEALGRGALGRCQRLGLSHNQISFTALPVDLGKGALRNCLLFNLSHNEISDEEMRALSEALGRGALKRCLLLNLSHNRISDRGLEFLAGALGIGALGLCKTLDLRHNKISDRGLEPLARVLDRGALKNCTKLDLEDNQISSFGMIMLPGSLTGMLSPRSGKIWSRKQLLEPLQR